MSKKEIRIGLIGYGFMGRTHSNAYSQLDHFFDTVRADHHRRTEVKALQPVSAVHMDGGGQHPALVLEVTLGHGDSRVVADDLNGLQPVVAVTVAVVAVTVA